MKDCYIVLFIDLYKEFDASYIILLDKLKSVGFDSNACMLFHSYLTGRDQAIVVDSHQCDFPEVKKGVPQRSKLGPILFNVYINNLGTYIDYCFIPYYADDTISSSVSN